MELFLFPVVVLFIICAIWTVKAIRVDRIFHNPLLMPIVFFGLGYPLRYTIAVAYPDLFSDSQLSVSVDVISVENVLLALLFSTAFIAMIGFGLRAMLPLYLRTFKSVKAETLQLARNDYVLVHIIFVAYIAVFGYIATTSGFRGLYEEFSQLKVGLIGGILGEVINLRWFIAALSIFAFLRTKKIVFLAQTMLVLFTVVYIALVTSSKGHLANAVLFLLVVNSMMGRKLPLVFAMTALLIMILFSVISYEIRNVMYFPVRDTANQLALLTSYGHLISNLDSIKALLQHNIVSVLDRATYYGDALLLMITSRHYNVSDIYLFGSLAELGNLIPTILWEQRPHLSFNHYVTGAVWGQTGILSEVPIGRIGEAYYVLRWLGFVIGLIYAFMFALICIYWHKSKNNIYAIAAWVGILMAWVLPDAYLTYGLKQVIAILCIAVGLNLCSRSLATKTYLKTP